MTDAFIGRSDEMTVLDDLLDAAKKWTPTTVVLGGEPGVGKSRLIDEFVASARSGPVHVLSGACIELGGGGVPYAPLIEALRLLARKHGENTSALAGPAWTELANLISDFTGSAPTGEPVGIPGSQLQVFGAVMRLLDHLGKNAPVLIIFEDLHWADPSTLDLVAYLTRAKSNQRMLLVCSYRTGLSAGHPLRIRLAEPEFMRRIRRIELSRFTEAELRLFLGRSGAVSRSVAQRYFDLSEGNVFFAEQLVESRALADATSARIPESLKEIMLTRIQSLSKDANRLMRVAATAGRRVSDRLLAAVSGLDDDVLNEALRECLEEGIIVADPTDDDTYVFRHALLREAVYGSLVARERRRLHAEMAVAITANVTLSLVRDLTSVELSHHWFNAGRQPEALEAAVRAGATTTRMRAFHEAETQYVRALQLWPQVSAPEVLAGAPKERILAAAADAARWAGHVTQAVDLTLAAITEVDSAADPHRSGELYERLGSYQWEAGQTDESVAAYQNAAELLTGRPPDALLARVQAGLATASVRDGRYNDGLRQAALVIEFAESVHARAEKGRALNTAGVALTMLDRPEEGVRFLREALAIADETEHLEDLLRAYGNLGVALEHAGRLPESVDAALGGLELATALGLGSARQGSILANNASEAMFLLGRWDAAIELLDDALLDRPSVAESAYLRLTHAEIDVARGDFDAADAWLGEVRSHSITDPRFIEPLHACDAELAIWRGNPAMAQDAAEAGIAAISDGENHLVRLRLCAIGLRAVADSALQAPDADTATARPADLLTAALDVDVATATPEIATLEQLCAAELARRDGDDTADLWRDIATAWESLGRPYPAAYARWREAVVADEEGDTSRAIAAADWALATAEQLRAEPLRKRIADVILPMSAHVKAGAGKVPYGLTRRELEVLLHVTDGLSNRQIAKSLFISDKTVSVHVSNVLKKLDVESRGGAAAVARRENIFVDPGASPGPAT